MPHPYTEQELARLEGTDLGRIATVDRRGRPHVVPTTFAVDRATGAIDITGFNLATSKKFKDIQANPHAAFVVDGLDSTDPWTPWGIEIRGDAEAIEDPTTPRIRLHPRRVVGWGIDTHPYTRNARDVSPPG